MGSRYDIRRKNPPRQELTRSPTFQPAKTKDIYLKIQLIDLNQLAIPLAMEE